MNISSAFAGKSLDDIKAALAGGTLTVYSVARPITPDRSVDRSGVLATFVFASPAFGEPQDGIETPVFVEASVPGAHDGTPGFARGKLPTALSSRISPPALGRARSNSPRSRLPRARR